MEVNNTLDHVTHAVMGGKNTTDFGISNSAEFFHILSSTLYKNQPLAVVRETLCNAWDAHIASGKQDTPITVNLLQGVLTIQDYGLGIAPEDFNTIYGVYGASTKTQDATQTGGFGLGCKAPFAYTDHFEVVSCHKGIKSIYRLSKSSSEVSGKPGITLIASFPTTESGLKVSIDIKPEDTETFQQHINNVVYDGDILTTFNGELLKTIGMVGGVSFVLDASSVTRKVCVRYGNVVYPLEVNNKYSKEFSAVWGIIQKIDNARTTSRLVLLAPPNSVSVTPSRESLSMQDKTVATVTELLVNFRKEFLQGYDEEAAAHTQSVVDGHISEGNTGNLLVWYYSKLFKEDTVKEDTLRTFKELRVLHFLCVLHHFTAYPKEKRKETLLKAASAGLLDKGKVVSYLKAKNKHAWLFKKVVGKVAAHLYNHPILSTANLMLRDTTAKSFAYDSGISITNHEVPAFLNNMVVITDNQIDLEKRISGKTKLLYPGNAFMFYRVGKRKGEYAAAVELFNKLGVHVVDIVPPPDVKLVPKQRVPKKPFIGWPTLKSLVVRGNLWLPSTFPGNPEYTKKPEFVYLFSKEAKKYKSGYAHGPLSITNTGFTKLAEMWGGVGVAVTDKRNYDKCIALGAVDFENYLHERLAKELITNPNIVEYLGVSVPYKAKDAQVAITFEKIKSNEEVWSFFKKHCNLDITLSPEEHVLVNIYQAHLRVWSSESEKYARLYKNLKDVPPHPGLLKLQDLITNPVAFFLDYYQINQGFLTASTTNTNYVAATNLLKHVFNI